MVANHSGSKYHESIKKRPVPYPTVSDFFISDTFIERHLCWSVRSRGSSTEHKLIVSEMWIALMIWGTWDFNPWILSLRISTPTRSILLRDWDSRNRLLITRGSRPRIDLWIFSDLPFTCCRTPGWYVAGYLKFFYRSVSPKISNQPVIISRIV